VRQITTISTDADQLIYMTLDDGSVLSMEFIYRPAIQRWSLNISHPKLTLNGFVLCVGPNILRQWRKLIPFGLAVTSSDGQDPVDINDFEFGRISLFLLSASEIDQTEKEILKAAA